jgi:hypothetical protein
MTRPDVKALADKYFLKTADQVPSASPKPRPPAPAEPAAMPRRTRWSYDRKTDFQRWGIAALYVAGPRAPVPRGIGDNRLGWPLRFGFTQSWGDTITPIMDTASPYHWQGVWFRLWVPTGPHARTLLTLLVDALAPSESFESQPGTLEDEIRRFIMAERARHAWHDVGPDFDLPMPDRKVEALLGLPPLARNATTLQVRERRFLLIRHKFKSALVDLAARHAIETWDDDGVERALDRMERERMASATRLGGKR